MPHAFPLGTKDELGHVRIPGVPGGTYGIDEQTTEEGGERLLKALDRLESDEPARFDSPAFGPMSDDERRQLNLRHGELHMSFLEFDAPGET